MSDENLVIELRCPKCRWATECAEADVARWLRGIGMLKRDPHVTTAELKELILAAAGRLACSQCDRLGLIATEIESPSNEWLAARLCTVCRKPIPADRLEVFPAATTCVGCQRADEQGRAPTPVDYCPKCGAPTTVRQTRGQGITRYSVVCTGQPPCRL